MPFCTVISGVMHRFCTAKPLPALVPFRQFTPVSEMPGIVSCPEMTHNVGNSMRE